MSCEWLWREDRLCPFQALGHLRGRCTSYWLFLPSSLGMRISLLMCVFHFLSPALAVSDSFLSPSLGRRLTYNFSLSRLAVSSLGIKLCWFHKR